MGRSWRRTSPSPISRWTRWGTARWGTACRPPSCAQTAVEILTEELSHLRHLRAGVTRLALGTPESRRRMQAALDQLWPLARQLFQPLPDEPILVEAGAWPASSALATEWQAGWRGWHRPMA